MKAGALFSGIGGFCLGFARAEIPTAWAVEADPHAALTYGLNLPNTRLINEDVRGVGVASHGLEPVDVLHAGFPCQSFSQAGARAGFDDARGRLFFEIIRLLREFGADRPKMLVLENAPYLRFGDGGAWFLRLQNEIRKAGYWFREDNAAELDSYRLTDLPQQRVRLFMVALSTAHFRSGRFSFPSPPSDPRPKDLEKYIGFDSDVEESYYLPKDNRYHRMISSAKGGDSAKGADRQIYQLRKYLVRTKVEGLCPTLTANMGLGGHNVPFVVGRRGLRKLTEQECLALQGFPLTQDLASGGGFRFPESVPRARRYTQVGNAVAVPVAERLAESVRDRLSNGSQ